MAWAVHGLISGMAGRPDLVRIVSPGNMGYTLNRVSPSPFSLKLAQDLVMKATLTLIGLLLLAAAFPAGAEVYQWTDDRGIRHFSNIAPPLNRDSLALPELSLPKGFSCQVIKIHDGDTVQVRGQGLAFKVRLAGIDCPESQWKTMPEQPFARQAKQALTDLILTQTVVLRQHGIGSYNRVLAEVFLRGRNVNLAMLRRGLAEVYQGRLPASLKKDDFVKAQAWARQNRLGIWSLGQDYISPKEWRKQHLGP